MDVAEDVVAKPVDGFEDRAVGRVTHQASAGCQRPYLAFVLRELDDMDPEAACEAAGISRDSLAVFLYRARQSPRACLQRKWAES